MADPDKQMERAPLAFGISITEGRLELPDGLFVVLGLLQTLALKEVVTGQGGCHRESIGIHIVDVHRCARLSNDCRAAACRSNHRGLVSGNYAAAGRSWGVERLVASGGNTAPVGLHGRPAT